MGKSRKKKRMKLLSISLLLVVVASAQETAWKPTGAGHRSLEWREHAKGWRSYLQAQTNKERRLKQHLYTYCVARRARDGVEPMKTIATVDWKDVNTFFRAVADSMVRECRACSKQPAQCVANWESACPADY